MRRAALAAELALTLLLAGGCKHQQNENDAIRAGIMQHLTGIGTLNMNAMEMNIKSVSINGNQAHAEVEFLPKGGAPGAGMQVTYNLEKRDGAWVVQKTQSGGGTINHPAPGTNPHQNVPSGNLPNFTDILNPSGAPASGTLPAGHPPVNPQPSAPQTGGQTSSSPEKPL